MPIWTDGETYVVATSWGIGRIDGENTETFVFPREGLKRDQDPPELVFFTMLDEEGRCGVIRRKGEPCFLWNAGATSLTEIDGPTLYDAVALGENQLLVAVASEDSGGQERLTLRRCRVDDNSLTLLDVVELPPAPRVQWQSSLASTAKWHDESSLGTKVPGKDAWAGQLRLHANAYGISVAASYSGIIAVLDKANLLQRVCVRVPTEHAQFDLFALPVPGGVVVTSVAGARDTEYAFIKDGGQFATSLNQFGKVQACAANSAGVAWRHDQILVNHQGSSQEVYALSLPDLKPKLFKDADDGLVIDAGASADGKVQLIAVTAPGQRRPGNWQLKRYDNKSAKPRAKELEMPEFRPPEPPPAPLGPIRAEGQPALGVTSRSDTAWTAKVGASVQLNFLVSNRGGVAEGIYIELGADAPAKDLLSGMTASVAGQPKSFEKKGSIFRAELKNVRMEAGLADPKEQKTNGAPPTSVVVEIRGEKVGNALMTVRIGPLNASGTNGSALQGKSFSVTE